MALQTNITTEAGINVSNAYCRVEKLSFTAKTSIAFNLASYVDQNKTTPFNVTNYLAKYDLEGSNPIKQAYLYLKTLPEYANSLDV
jgi:hypothetical protein